MTDTPETGVYISEYCPRGRKDCSSLAQIISEEGSFVCCGHNDGSTRKIKQDRFRMCFKNKVIDSMEDWDEQDLFDTQSVISQALCVDYHIRENSK